MGNDRVAQKWKERLQRAQTPEARAEAARREAEDLRMLTDEEVQAIRDDLNNGTRGPVVLKCIRQLLADHDERVKRETALMELLEEAHEREHQQEQGLPE